MVRRTHTQIFLVLFGFAVQNGTCQQLDVTSSSINVNNDGEGGGTPPPTLLGRIYGELFSGRPLGEGGLFVEGGIADNIVAGAYEVVTGQSVSSNYPRPTPAAGAPAAEEQLGAGTTTEDAVVNPNTNHGNNAALGPPRPGAPGAGEPLDLLTCTQSDVCYNGSTQTPGAWTCRPNYVGYMSICVPTILGLTLGRQGDSCGCCGGVCPQKCQCECTTTRGMKGYMTHFELFFGLVQFDQCLESTVVDAATSLSTSLTTIGISCSDICEQEFYDEFDQDQ